MLAILIISLSILTFAAAFIFYYNNIAQFHRIHLYGCCKPSEKQSGTVLPPVFNLQSRFEKKNDRQLLELLALRHLPVIVCLGDSITHGIISTNYVEMLQEKYSERCIFVNSGLNGNLAYNLRQRLPADCIVFKPDIVTILIGTNDVNSRKNDKTMKNYIKTQQLPQNPDRQFFLKNLTDIVRRIQMETNAKIAILSLPVIGENLDSQINSLAKEYSKDIKEIAEKHKITYLPLNEEQTIFLKQIKNRKPPKDLNRRIFLTILLMLRRGFDKIAEINGRYLTYDGLHETTKGAGMICSLISGFLDKNTAK